MDLRKQLAGLKVWIPLLLVAAVVSGGIAFIVSGTVAKTFESRAILVIGQSLSAMNPDFSELMASQRLSSTYAELATKRPIMDAVIEELSLDESAASLSQRVAATVGSDTTFLSIAVTDADPTQAAEIANAVAAELIASSPELQGQEADIRAFVSEELRATQAQIVATQAQIAELAAIEDRTVAETAQLNTLEDRLTTLRSSYAALLSFASNDASNLVTVVEPAVPVLAPVAPRPILNALLAGILTVLLVTGALLLATYFDRRLKDAEAVQEAVGLPTLGTIPRMRDQRDRREMYQLAMLLYPRSAAAESYRTLRANLEFSSVDSRIATLLVTSSVPGEGKTVTSVNLAVAFAQAGRRVLLVDADLRKPGVHAMFNVPNGQGLSDLIRDGARWERAIQLTEEPNLNLLTTGAVPPNPAELLGTQRMRGVLDRLKESYDILIIDSPPLLPVADPAILSSLVDGTLLVVDASRTRRDDLRRAKEALTKANARVLGVLLNGLPATAFSGYGEYYGADVHAPTPVPAAEPSQARTAK